MIHVGAGDALKLEEQAFSDGYYATDIHGKFPPNGRYFNIVTCFEWVYYLITSGDPNLITTLIFDLSNFIRCISNQSRNGKSGPSEEGENIRMTSFFEVDDLVDYVNNSMGDGTVIKSE